MSPFHEKVVPLRVPVPVATTQGTLALDLSPRHDPPAAPVVSIGSRQHRGAERWARQFAQAAVEIVGGDRPSSQLLRWTSSRVFADLERRTLLVARAGAHQPGHARVQPVRPRVQSVHVCFVDDEILEASVHVRYGDRSRAVAARFEVRSSRWLCTALEFA